MCNTPLQEPALFANFTEVASAINRSLVAAKAIAKYVWVYNCERCGLRKFDPYFKVVMCKYPEQINCTNKNNCTYEYCPLIKRQGGHDV